MPSPLPRYSDEDILSARGPKSTVDPFIPYAYLVEPECNADGSVEDVATIFLTNRECPFRCLMCDLWKNTTDETVPAGAIPRQIDYALDRLPAAQSIKLYNSGNFFDAQAIPRSDFPDIANRLLQFKTVIVENHPKLCNDSCLQFRDLLEPDLEIALGLETVHEAILARMNKQMTLDDFERAARFLTTENISARAFILLKPPFLSEEEGIHWALKSIEFAFFTGVSCCSIIPTRTGNGMLEQLLEKGEFLEPSLVSMETVLETAIEFRQGRGFMDVWDADRFFDCPDCGPERVERLQRINLSQQLEPPIACHCRSTP